MVFHLQDVKRLKMKNLEVLLHLGRCLSTVYGICLGIGQHLFGYRAEVANFRVYSWGISIALHGSLPLASQHLVMPLWLTSVVCTLDTYRSAYDLKAVATRQPGFPSPEQFR